MSVLAVIVGLALLGSPLFVIVGAATALAFMNYAGEIHHLLDFAWVIDPFEELMGKDQFLAIPLFVGAGALMTEGGMARRLVAFTRALLGWLPGGVGMAAVGACMGFAAISGSSPVTLIAVGSIMYPALVGRGYSENFSLGLVMTAGSLEGQPAGWNLDSCPSRGTRVQSGQGADHRAGSSIGRRRRRRRRRRIPASRSFRGNVVAEPGVPVGSGAFVESLRGSIVYMR